MKQIGLFIIFLSTLVGCYRAPVNSSIVLLTGNDRACTGFQIQAPSGKDYLITAGHCSELVVEGSIKVTTEAGNTVYSRVVQVDSNADLLLLDPVPGLFGLKLALGDFPAEPIHIIGHGYALPLWEVKGSIIGDMTMIDWLETICSAPAAPGHSGSPVLDPLGNVVGVLSTSNGIISGFVRLTDLQTLLKGY